MKLSKIIIFIVPAVFFLQLHGKNDLNENFLKLLGTDKKSRIAEEKDALKQEPRIIEEKDDISLQLLKILGVKAPEITENEIQQPLKFYKGQIERLGIEYLDTNRYNSPAIKMPVISGKELPLFDRLNLKKYGWLIEQKYEAPWYMQLVSERVGYGIFAAADFEDGDFIGEYTGIIHDEQSFKALMPFDPNYSWNINPPANYHNMTTKFYVDAKKSCNFARFINHSYNPNVKPVTIYAKDGWHIIYVACKSIKKDEQILVNYGEGYWQGRTPETL